MELRAAAARNKRSGKSFRDKRKDEEMADQVELELNRIK